MTTPLAELLTQVPSLNNPDEPVVYAVVGNTITASWDVVHAKYIEFGKLGALDKDYVLVVDFDEEKGTFDFEETKHESEASIDSEGVHGQKSFFQGKSTSKSFSFTAGGVYNTPEGGNSLVLTYEFETKRVKQPLFDFLEANGWKRKKGFLGGLFGN